MNKVILSISYILDRRQAVTDQIKAEEDDTVLVSINGMPTVVTIGSATVDAAVEKALIGMCKGESKKIESNATAIEIRILSVSKLEGPRSGLWDALYTKYTGGRLAYGDPKTMQMGAAFLNVPDVRTVEDWGCGYGGFRDYVSPHQEYIGVDGSSSPFADIHADLEDYRSEVDAIFVRHVLEHNPGWEKVLRNALASFKRRFVLVIFTPFAKETRILKRYPGFGNSGITMIDISFKREDLISFFHNVDWSSEENIPTDTQYKCEHIFYISKRQ